jgi:hypothetical protein
MQQETTDSARVQLSAAKGTSGEQRWHVNKLSCTHSFMTKSPSSPQNGPSLAAADMAPGDRGGPSAREGACSDIDRAGGPCAADGGPPPRDARPVWLMLATGYSAATAQA